MKRILCTLLMVMLLSGCAAAEPSARTEVLFINVGKADAALLWLEEKVYLVDTGTQGSYPALRLALRSQGIERLDAVFITHTDKDHVGGLPLLLDSGVKVDTLYAPLLSSEKKLEKHPVYEAAQESGVPLVWLEAGQSLTAGEGYTLSVLGPLVQDMENENNNSLVLRVDTPQGSLLLSGDMELEEERTLLQAGVLTATDVLKVSNHGDGDASSRAMVNLVRPQVAVISTNSVTEPDTPNSSVLGWLWDVGAQVFLTEKATCGIRVALSGGQATAYLENYADLPPVVSGLRLSALDPENDTVALTNDTGDTISLGGCMLASTRGEEIFVFPDDAQIAPSQTLIIGTRTTVGKWDYQWPDKQVWHRKKQDDAVLLDVYGRELSRTSNGR